MGDEEGLVSRVPGRRVAILAGEYQKHAHWPDDLYVEQYRSDTSDAARVALKMRNGTIDHAIVVGKPPKNSVVASLRGSGGHVYAFDGSINSLSQQIHSITGIAPPKETPVATDQPEIAPPVDPMRGLAPAVAIESHRAQRWTADEVEAIIAAYSECDDSPELFVEGFNEYTDRKPGLGIAAALWHKLPGVARERQLTVSEDFLRRLRALCVPAAQAADENRQAKETPSEWITTAEAARIFEIPEATLRGLAGRHEVGVRRDGDRWLYWRNDIAGYATKRRVEKQAEEAKAKQGERRRAVELAVAALEQAIEVVKKLD